MSTNLAHTQKQILSTLLEEAPRSVSVIKLSKYFAGKGHQERQKAAKRSLRALERRGLVSTKVAAVTLAVLTPIGQELAEALAAARSEASGLEAYGFEWAEIDGDDS